MNNASKLFVSIASLAVGGVAAVCHGADGRQCERGGFTFDFGAISNARFGGVSSVGNLAEGLDGWKSGYGYLHNAKVPASDPRRREIKKGIEWRREGSELVVGKSAKLVDICGNAKMAECVSGGWSRTVALPDVSGGVYRLSFKYRMRHDVGEFGGVLFTPRLAKSVVGTANAKEPGMTVYHLPNLWSEDGMWSKDIRVPPMCDRIEIIMRIDGIGELRFSDFALTRREADTPVTVQFAPAAYLDGTFAFSSGQCGMMCVQWQRNDDAVYAAGTFEHELTLPKGYALVEAVMAETNDVAATALADGSVRYRMKANLYAGGVPPAEFSGWSPLSMLVRADAGAPRGTATFATFCKGRQVSNVAKVEVFTMPEIKAPQPKRFGLGFYPGGPSCAFRTRAAQEGFADLFTAAGSTWVTHMRANRDVYAMWRAKGIRCITPEWYLCANGFRVGDGKGRPEDQKYVTQATGNIDYARATCPIAVYEEKSYFRDVFLPQMRKFLDGADGLWANWEPYYFGGRGCFCDNCCRAFAEWMKVPYAEVRKGWPQNLKWGERYGREILKFRSWQHGRLVKTINRHVVEATGGERSVGFIPGISWCEMSSGWRPNNLAAEVQAIDYAGALRWIDPWGPYVWWRASSPYLEQPEDLLGYWCAAKDVRGQVNADYMPQSRPKLLAFPHGIQGEDALCQPEGITVALDAFFFNGWEAAVVYAFPRGYDARWWQAFADAAVRAARYEDAVLDGKRVDASVTLLPDAGYPAPARNIKSTYLSWTKSVPYLQCAAYDHGGRRICAVMNFAHHATAGFTLKTAGLPSGRYQVVSEDGVKWPREGVRRTFSAEELASVGVRLSVGAVRTKVFEIRPAR